MIVFILSIIFFILFSVRFLRWLAIVQQKEYRLDRLLLFLRSPEGKIDFFRLIPAKNEFTRTGLKRPVRTIRVKIVAFLSLLIILILARYVIFDQTNSEAIFDALYFAFLSFVYFFLPLLIMLAIVPTAVLAYVVTLMQLKQAKNKFNLVKPLIIGITGSYGKTTTKLLLAHILKRKYKLFVTPKSFNTKYSVPRSINKGFTNQNIAVLEYAAYTKGEIKFLCKYFRPDIAIITGLTHQHLGLFGSLANIVKAKAELIKALADKTRVFANAKDPGTLKICQAGGAKKVISFSGDKEMVKLSHYQMHDDGISFSWKGRKVKTNLVGLHYLDAIKATIVVAKYLELSDSDIIKRLKSFKQPGFFISLKKGKNNCLVIDDSRTANPAGFIAALALLHWYKEKAKKTVLITGGIVDLGRKSNSIHQQLASQAKKVTDLVLYTGKAGKQEFEAVFKTKFVNSREQILVEIANFDQKTIVLIEGKLPLWLAGKLAISSSSTSKRSS